MIGGDKPDSTIQQPSPDPKRRQDEGHSRPKFISRVGFVLVVFGIYLVFTFLLMAVGYSLEQALEGAALACAAAAEGTRRAIEKIRTADSSQAPSPDPPEDTRQVGGPEASPQDTPSTADRPKITLEGENPQHRPKDDQQNG
jgi:hypothetical protein